MEEKEIVPWESLDLNADQKASSAKEALRNRVDKMPHPVDALPSPPCWLSVYIQSGPPSYLVSDGDCTWAQWHGHPHTKMELLASAERTMCQQQGPALSLNMSPFPRGTSQPSKSWLLDYIRLYNERGSIFALGECFMFWVGICFLCLQICQLCWLAEYLIYCYCIKHDVASPRAHISWWK